MSNSKITALTSATTPLAGTEVLPIVQSSTTKQVSVANLTAGRDVTFLTGRATGTLTGSTTKIGIRSSPVGASDVTANLYSFYSDPTTASASFTLSSLYHYRCVGLAAGSGSTITNQYGFYADSGLTAATNNYGFFGNIASATGAWNLYMNGTASNYLAGGLGIGSTSLTNVNLNVGKSVTGSTSSFGVYTSPAVQSDVTATAAMYTSAPSTAAASFTVASLIHYQATQSTIGSGSAITNQYGFIAQSSLTGATNNYGFHGNLASGAGRYNFYAAGTADNWFSGNVLIGGAGGLGYTTGSGGTVTQGTSRTTGVTLNKTNGAITLFTAAGSITATTFTVTNSTVAATDVVHVCQKSGTNLYNTLVTAVAAGSFNITFYTTGGVASDAPVFNFTVIKAATA